MKRPVLAPNLVGLAHVADARAVLHRADMASIEAHEAAVAAGQRIKERVAS